MRNTPGNGRLLSYYDWGATPYYALQADARFSYCMYVPQSYDEDASREYPLVVLVHGTERWPHMYRDAFEDFCETHQCSVVAPLFPVGVGEAGDLNGYKYLDFAGVRYDRVLLQIVDEVAAKWRSARNFMLFGFSGGGHFSHRFAYLHPQRLTGVSIGAPGLVTLLDFEAPAWRGVADLRERLGNAVDLGALRRVPVQMVVGAQDTQTWEIAVAPGSPFHIPGVNDESTDRIGRLRALQASWERHDIAVRFDIVPGVAHRTAPVLPTVQAFFADVMRAARERSP